METNNLCYLSLNMYNNKDMYTIDNEKILSKFEFYSILTEKLKDETFEGLQMRQIYHFRVN